MSMKLTSTELSDPAKSDAVWADDSENTGAIKMTISGENCEATDTHTGATNIKCVSEAALSETALSETTVSETTVSEAAVSEATVSEAAVSEADMSETTMSETTVSEVAVSETDVSETAVSEAAVSETVNHSLHHTNSIPVLVTACNKLKSTNDESSGQRRLSKSISELDQQLLAKLHMLNQDLENDSRMIMNVSPETSRKQSDGKTFEDTDSMKSTGSQSSSNTDHVNNNISTPQERSPEEQLVHTWSQLMHDWQNIIKKRQQYIKELVYKGVPHQLRCLAWQYLCGAENSTYKDKYSDYLKQTSACEKVIRRDIDRTYPGHKFFKDKDGQGQQSLFNVMKAYSLHDREVGYCQGSGFIVGLLLMLMPEEETFCVLIQIMVEYKMRDLFKPGMAELGTCMYQLEYLIQEHSPPLYQHFQAQSFHTSMYASGWFLTLFTTQLPLELCFRIMDIFLHEGMEIIFRLGVALLLLDEADLLCMDMEGMLLYFQEKVSQIYDDADSVQSLMDVATNKVKYNAKRMRSLEKEYLGIKRKENEDQVELRRLRSENRLLRQRIENLEKENVNLADRLIQGQVTRAQEAEVMFSVKRELSQLREQNKELYRSLSASEDQITELKTKKQDDIESDEKFQALQEELIAVKLREAESNLALRELINHVAELDKEWKKQLERTPKDKLSKPQAQALHEELMSNRLKVAECNTNNKQLRLRVMELETGSQITGNQVQRLMDENERLRGDMSSSRDKEQTLSSEAEELRNKITELDSKSKEEVMKYKINDAEQSQLVAELRQQIADLEISKQEYLVTNEIVHTPTHQTHEIKEFKDEFKLNSKMTFSTLDLCKGTADSDSASDTEESDKHTNLDIALSSGKSNTMTNGNAVLPNKPRARQLTSMEMDAEDEGIV